MIRIKNTKNLFVFICLLGLFILFEDNSYAQDNLNPAYSSSGLPIPRFVSLSNNKTNVRAGPGQEYPVNWVYNRASLPIEVILEYDNWRKIRDYEGQEGWIYHTLLSGQRTGLIQGDTAVNVFERPVDHINRNRVVLMIEPNALVYIESCKSSWCAIKTSGYSGWIKRNLLWGVYESEKID